MSRATGKHAAGENDNFPTPRWALARFLDEWPALGQVGNRWVEPCAGDGVLIETANQYRDDLIWTAVEVRDTRQDLIRSGVGSSRALFADVFDLDFGDDDPAFVPYDVALLNPPFRLTMEFLELCRKIARKTVLLQRMNFIGSGKRNDYMRANTPDCWIVPDRVSFSQDNGNDSVENAWHVWPPDGDVARIHVLQTTPLAERKADRARVRAALGVDHAEVERDSGLSGT